jgi:outer membrane receptor protein involved in Fe transport
MDSGFRSDGRTETSGLRSRVLGPLLGLLLLALLCTAPAVEAVEGPEGKVRFNLASDEFPKAILEFYHQSKIEVLFLANDSLSQIHTQPVVGEFEPGEALARMLKGTGLTFKFATEHSVTIKQPVVADIPPPPRPPPPRPPEPSVHHYASATPVVGHNKLEEVTVTGSLIHGAVDVMAPLVYITPQQISQAPFPTVQDTLNELPINSLTAPREDLGLNNNYNRGAGVNLRGLGVGATLVLVNGHRQPLSGFNGDFVDVSNIPGAAIDRIEVLPDGASASYGSDAVAGVVNIILRDDFQGAETRVRYGGTPGGHHEIDFSQLLGTHWDTGRAMLVYEYQDATELNASARGYAATADKRPYGGADYRSFNADPANILDPTTYQPISANINLENQFARYQLFPQKTQNAVYATGAQHLGDSIELFAEGRFTQRNTYIQGFPAAGLFDVPGSNPFNPFPGSDTIVGYSFLNTLGPATFASETRNYVGTLGAHFKLGAGWQATLSETYGRENLFQNEYNILDSVALDNALAESNAATAFNVFGATNPNTLAEIRSADFSHATSGIETTSFVADGPLFDLPAGPAKLAAGVERREESLAHTVPISIAAQETADARYSRHVGSAFTELSLPLVGSPDKPRAVPRLELTLAGRYDDYSDFGHAMNPEARLRFTPVDSLKLRGSWGRSYRAPKLDDLYDSAYNLSGLGSLVDPQSPTGRSVVLALQGDNPNLRQETATTWTAGFDLVPEIDPRLTLSLTYYSVDYTGQIAQPAAADPYDVLLQGNQWSAVITRNPTQAQIAAVCNRPDFFGSVASCLASSPAAIVDYRLANLSSTRVTGLDLNVHQEVRGDFGNLDFGLQGNYVFHFNQTVTQASPNTDILNTFGNPLKLRLRGTAGWSESLPDSAGLGANLAVNFTNGYNNFGSSLIERIPSLTTVDLQVRYHTGNGGGFLADVEFALNAVNVFNQSPPFVDSVYGYDSANFQPFGRVLSLSVTKKW